MQVPTSSRAPTGLQIHIHYTVPPWTMDEGCPIGPIFISAQYVQQSKPTGNTSTASSYTENPLFLPYC